MGIYSSGRKVLFIRLVDIMKVGIEKSATTISVEQSFVRKVIVYTYNEDWGRYEKYGTLDLLEDDKGLLKLSNGAFVQENHDYKIPFKYWVVDEWDTYYYFD